MSEQNNFRCASVFTHKEILIYDCERKNYLRASYSPKLKDEIFVGDFVSCEFAGEDLYVTSISERKNIIQRLVNKKIQVLATNIDVIFIVTSANKDFNMARLERYYIIAKDTGAKIFFVLSKYDLTNESEKYVKIIKERFPNCEVFKTSIFNYDQNNFELFCGIKNKWEENETAIFLGSSGVGKSSLINMMLGEEKISTQPIRESDSHGKHTTTVRQMIILKNNRIIIDSPGIRSVGISNSSESIKDLFPEIISLENKCQFKNCSHSNEKNCAIREALDSGELDPEIYQRYLKLSRKEETQKIFLKGKDYEQKNLVKEMRKQAPVKNKIKIKSDTTENILKSKNKTQKNSNKNFSKNIESFYFDEE
ncbi:MAG: ribosome small subunit-dependent GTPase A [Fusobacteriaceae bacterium]